MLNKPIALIVDDDREWLSILEDILGSNYQVEKAKSVSEVDKIIRSNGTNIKIALVDIRLEGEVIDKESGLSAMFSLSEAGIPCIAVTNSDNNGIAIRDAFVSGKAKDVWFKNEKNVDLREKIKKILTTHQNTISDYQLNSLSRGYLIFVGSLLIIPIVISILFAAISFLLPNNYLVIIGVTITLIIIIYLLIALFYNKITGEEFTELIKFIFTKK